MQRSRFSGWPELYAKNTVIPPDYSSGEMHYIMRLLLFYLILTGFFLLSVNGGSLDYPSTESNAPLTGFHEVEQDGTVSATTTLTGFISEVPYEQPRHESDRRGNHALIHIEQ